MFLSTTVFYPDGLDGLRTSFSCPKWLFLSMESLAIGSIVKYGIRQGYPLSPSLLILVADSLAKLFNIVACSNIFHSLGNAWLVGGHSILQYADDMLIFDKADECNISALKVLLYFFELILTIFINFQKSLVVPIGHDHSLLRYYVVRLNYSLFDLPGCYLGLPLRDGKLSRSDWMPLVQKFEYRPSPWKGNYHSFGGRLVLSKVFFLDLPIYYKSLFKFPSWLTSKLIKFGEPPLE